MVESPRWRRFAVAAFAATGLPAIVLYARVAAPIITDGDFAVTELYAELATRARLFVGPYSRFGWHHPGPFYFYVLAPFYALSGRRAAVLYAAALGINLAAIATLAWVVAGERRRRPLAVILAGGCVWFAWRAPMFLASPWTAHVPVLPCLTFLVLAAAVAGGRVTLLPLMAVFASFVAQTHVAYVPIVAAITALVLACCYIERPHDRRLLVKALQRSALMSAALWLLPIGESLSGDGGNAAALWRFFATEAGPGHSFREALLTWSYGLSGVLRPDFILGWGGHFELTHLSWGVPCAIGQLVLLAAIAFHDLKAERRFEGCLAMVALTASAVALWSLTRIRGDILDHDVFRIAALGVLNLAIIAAAGLRGFFDAGANDGDRRTAAIASGFVMVLALTLAVGWRDLEQLTSFERRRTDRRAIVAAYSAIRDYVVATGIRRPLFRIDNDRWGNAAGILLRLRQDGTPASVQDPGLSMFPRTFAVTGDEDALITLANLDLHRELRARPDTVVLIGSGPLYVDATRIAPAP